MKRSQMVKKLATTIENSKVANVSSKVLADSLLAECEKNGMNGPSDESYLNFFAKEIGYDNFSTYCEDNGVNVDRSIPQGWEPEND